MLIWQRFFLSVVLCLTATNGFAQSAQSVTLTSYHKFPPFITGEGTGLTHDLAAYLSSRSERYRFTVDILPRNRVDLLLADGPAIVPWVSPTWFGADAETRFDWSDSVLEDGSVYVWHQENQNTFGAPDDLVGHQLIGVRGYKYVGVDTLVAEGRVNRMDVATERQLMQMILFERADVGIAPASGTFFLIQQENWRQEFRTAPHHKFQRRILMKTADTALQDFIKREVQALSTSAPWREILGKYGVSWNQ